MPTAQDDHQTQLWAGGPTRSKGASSARPTARPARSPLKHCRPAIRTDRARSYGTAIYYLLTADTFSELHRLPTEEVFHLYLGGPVRMLQIFPDGHAREIILGNDILAGHQPQVIVPPGVWQGSRVEPGGDGFALLGATMAPGFDYADYEQGRRADLIRQFPAHAHRIIELTRV